MLRDDLLMFNHQFAEFCWLSSEILQVNKKAGFHIEIQLFIMYAVLLVGIPFLLEFVEEVQHDLLPVLRHALGCLGVEPAF